MRGVVDDRGRCPFWEGLGRHFFDIDFPKADTLSMRNKRFIAELMPTHPIYIVLLPQEAQAVIGKVHRDTEPALRMLQEEGFQPSGMIDIFDGGPVIACARDRIRTVRESRRAQVVAVGAEAAGPPTHVVSGTERDFRACLGSLDRDATGGVLLPGQVAEALRVAEGDVVRYAPLRPSSPQEEAG
jgi:arginine N-succinyltransferase